MDKGGDEGTTVTNSMFNENQNQERQKRPWPFWRMWGKSKAKMVEMQHFGCRLSLYHKEEEEDDTFTIFYNKYHNKRNKHISDQPMALFLLACFHFYASTIRLQSPF